MFEKTIARLLSFRRVQKLEVQTDALVDAVETIHRDNDHSEKALGLVIPNFLRDGREVILPPKITSDLLVGFEAAADDVAGQLSSEPDLLQKHLGLSHKIVEDCQSRRVVLQRIIDLATEGLRRTDATLAGYEGLQHHLESHEQPAPTKSLAAPRRRPTRKRQRAAVQPASPPPPPPSNDPARLPPSGPSVIAAAQEERLVDAPQ